MKKILCVGDKTGITAVACPDCGTPMEKQDGGYTSVFSGGEYIQVELRDWWWCPKCNTCMDEEK